MIERNFDRSIADSTGIIVWRKFAENSGDIVGRKSWLEKECD
jgi:hypothetical protein